MFKSILLPALVWDQVTGLESHEMAKENSPGLQAWVSGPKKFALKGRPISVRLLESLGCSVEPFHGLKPLHNPTPNPGVPAVNSSAQRHWSYIYDVRGKSPFPLHLAAEFTRNA